MPKKSYYVASDAMGNATAILDENGNVLERRRYEAFGEMNCMTPDGTPIVSSAVQVDVGFQNQIRDEVNGLYQMGYRWLIPTLGRWASKDPMGISGGDNDFSFANNCPTSLSDDSGLKVTKMSKKNSPHIREFGTLTYDVTTSDSCPDVEIGNIEYKPEDEYAAGFLSMIGVGVGLGIGGSTKLMAVGVGVNLFNLNSTRIKSKLTSSELTPCGKCQFIMKKTYDVTVINDVSYGNLNVAFPLGPKIGGGTAGGLLSSFAITSSFNTGISIYRQPNAIEYETSITVQSNCLPKC